MSGECCFPQGPTGPRAPEGNNNTIRSESAASYQSELTFDLQTNLLSSSKSGHIKFSPQVYKQVFFFFSSMSDFPILALLGFPKYSFFLSVSEKDRKSSHDIGRDIRWGTVDPQKPEGSVSSTVKHKMTQKWRNEAQMIPRATMKYFVRMRKYKVQNTVHS